MRTKNKTAIALFCFLLAASVVCEAKEPSSSSVLIDPDIKGDPYHYCWYDNERLVFLSDKSLGSGPFQPGGLYYLNIQKPTEHHRIDLSLLSESDQKSLNNVYCQDNTLLFSLGSSSPDHPDRNRVYSLKLGERPELIAEMRGLGNPLRSVNLKAKYVLGNSRRITPEGPLRGAFEGHDDCSIAYVKPGFKALCWDTWLKAHWPLSKFVIAQYRWEDRIKIKGEDGKKKYIPNPEKPRLSKDGKTISVGLDLRKLDGTLLPPISYASKSNAGYASPAELSIKQVSSDEKFLYFPCNRLGNHDPKFTVYEQICRVDLAGNQGLEEIFNIHSDNDKGAIIGSVSLSQDGDIYFVVNDEKKFTAIWKFSTDTKKVEQVTHPPRYYHDKAPQASPDGKKVAFKRPSEGLMRVFIVETNAAKGGNKK